MIKKITRKVMKEVEETVSSVGICDMCGKEFNYEEGLTKVKRAYYYQILTGHHDWGNDSCDSMQYTDACCDECLLRFIQNWLQDKDVIRSHTAYIEINKQKHTYIDEDKAKF